MAIQSRDTIASWFQRGMKPLAAQFATWLESFVHKNDGIPMGSVTGLEAALGSAATLPAVKNLFTQSAELNSNGSIVLQQDFYIAVNVVSNKTLNLTIGTTNGGNEVTPFPVELTANVPALIGINIIAQPDKTLYFSGISGHDATVSFLFIKIPIA